MLGEWRAAAARGGRGSGTGPRRWTSGRRLPASGEHQVFTQFLTCWRKSQDEEIADMETCVCGCVVLFSVLVPTTKKFMIILFCFIQISNSFWNPDKTILRLRHSRNSSYLLSQPGLQTCRVQGRYPSHRPAEYKVDILLTDLQSYPSKYKVGILLTDLQSTR